MASVSGSVLADEKHSLPSRSMDHMMDTQTSQDADAQVSNEHNANPWITVTKRANKSRQLQRHTVATQQLPSMPSEPALCQSRPKTRLPRLPPLPAEEYKLAIRPHGGLNLSKVSPKTLLLAVVHAANMRSEKPDIKLRVDENQNVLTISSSSEHIAMALGQITKITMHAATYDITSYDIAPDNSCKGVVNGIGHEITPDDFLTEVEVLGYEVLTCRRLGNSGAMVLTFCSKRVLFFVNTYGQDLRCYLYKRTIPHCRKCNKTGHREDVCPQPPDTPKCRVCGNHYHPTTTSATLLACFVVATTRRLPNHAQSGFCHLSTDANHPGQLLPPRRPSHHLPAPDSRAVRPGVQPGEGAIPGISRGPSKETRHRGVVSLASRDLKAGTWTGQRIIMASKAVPTRKHKREALQHQVDECGEDQGGGFQMTRGNKRGSLAEERVGSVGHSSREEGFSVSFVEVVWVLSRRYWMEPLKSGKESLGNVPSLKTFDDADVDADAGLLRLPPCVLSCLGPFV
ncbi:hypothetical protein HPB51_017108 [Rhipicephalus microplus]|uniref:CCHC-type domain-containing protein n=1 Tax=Rhipicephalus microplus TaxID=6941 RepID=A0A9J6DIR1_RHIMP|nr:hypothetical protein HPB51_017108 [Rhipicephalus microplus]